jgi:hypothetical protein
LIAHVCLLRRVPKSIPLPRIQLQQTDVAPADIPLRRPAAANRDYLPAATAQLVRFNGDIDEQ